MLEYLKCNLCSQEDFKVLYKSNLNHHSIENSHYVCTNFSYRRHGQIVRCNGCGLVYMNPRPIEEEILQRYQSVVDLVYLEGKKGRYVTFDRALKKIEALKPKGRILDVGCYAGFFLEVANRRGWDTFGVEPCSWACEYARRELGLDVRQGELKDVNFPSKHFDVVTLWDVLEHLVDPLMTFKEIHRILKEDGLLCLTTINIDSAFASLMGRMWPELMQMHTYYYSKDTLKKLLYKANFEIIKIESHTRIVRLQYLISRLNNYFPNLTKLCLGLSNLFRVGDVLVSVNLGDLLMVYAKKIDVGTDAS